MSLNKKNFYYIFFLFIIIIITNLYLGTRTVISYFDNQLDNQHVNNISNNISHVIETMDYENDDTIEMHNDWLDVDISNNTEMSNYVNKYQPDLPNMVSKDFKYIYNKVFGDKDIQRFSDYFDTIYEIDNNPSHPIRSELLLLNQKYFPWIGNPRNPNTAFVGPSDEKDQLMLDIMKSISDNIEDLILQKIIITHLKNIFEDKKNRKELLKNIRVRKNRLR